MQVGGAPVDRPFLALHHPLPGELVRARHAGVAPCAGEDRARDVVLRRGAFAPKLAVHLIAVLVRPDAAALEARGAVGESNHLGLKSDAGPARTGEQHRALQIHDRAKTVRAEGDGVTAAQAAPRAAELELPAGRCGRPRRLLRRSAGRGGEGQAKEKPTTPHVATSLLITLPRRACEESHVSLPG